MHSSGSVKLSNFKQGKNTFSSLIIMYSGNEITNSLQWSLLPMKTSLKRQRLQGTLKAQRPETPAEVFCWEELLTLGLQINHLVST